MMKLDQVIPNPSHRAALVQFIKYGLCGAAATVIHLVVFYGMGLYLLPAFGEGDPIFRLPWLQAPAEWIEPAVRAKRATVYSVTGFMLSNLAAYVMNVLWVFKGGRHHWLVEIVLFYLVAGISLAVGTGLQWWLIARFNLSTSLAFFLNIGASLMINYVVRKKLIFKG